MTAQIDLPTALSALADILTTQFNALNDEPPEDPPPPLVDLIGNTAYGFQSIYGVRLRIIIRTPSYPNSNSESDSEQPNCPQPQLGSRPVIWECPALARNFSLLPAEIKEFMEMLEKVNVSSLEQDARECDICKKEFSHLPDAVSSTDPTSVKDTRAPTEQSATDEEPENPVRLACGHIYGEDCLQKWIIGSGSWGLPSCPMCRAVLEKGDIGFTEVSIMLDRVGALSSMP